VRCFILYYIHGGKKVSDPSPNSILADRAEGLQFYNGLKVAAGYLKPVFAYLYRYHAEGAEPGVSIANISKFTYGHFEHTVNNFGILLHRNFVGASTLLQAQKFGSIASKIDKYMQEEKDKPA
jgi:hypothetical protein